MQPNLSPVEWRFLYESNAIEGEYGAEQLYNAALAWDYLRQQKQPLATINVLTTHRLLMKNLLRSEWIGAFKPQGIDVFVGNHPTLPSALVPSAIEKWLEGMNSKPADSEACKRLHIGYEAIHPFCDGNGRTGRMFYNWQRKHNGLPLDIIFEIEKNKYYQWFGGEVRL